MTEPTQRPVGLPPLRERPEVQTTVPHTAASWLVTMVGRPVWLLRRELAVVLLGLAVGAGAVGMWWWGGAWPWAVLGSVAGWTLLGAGLRLSRVRRWLRHGRIRRHWDAACRFARVETVSVRVPRIRRIEEFPAGYRLTVRAPKGISADDLESAAEKLAVVLDVREVKVTRDPEFARYPTVDIIQRNPFRDSSGAPTVVDTPLLVADSWSLWDAVPVGIDEVGASAQLRLPGRNILVGGEPEAGKSVAASNILGAAALDAECRIWGIDAKQVELAMWDPVMAGAAYTMDEATDLVEYLVSEMDARYAKMRAESLRGISRDLGWLLELLAIDELRFFTAHPDKKKRERFNLALIDLVARGRAAGYPVVAATQKPSNDVVPTSLRDLFAYRWALRCSTRDASNTILGAGWASEGHTASTIAPEDRGVGLLLAEGGTPRLVKGSSLSDADIRLLVSRGCRVKGGD